MNLRIIKPASLLALCLLAFAGPARAQSFAMVDPRPAIAPTTDLIYGPFVNAVTPNSATIHWITLPTAQVSCKLPGEPAAKIEFSAVPIPNRTDIRHTATITGLAPDQTHWYTITAGTDHADGSFHTAPPVGTRKPFTFIITGDTQSWPLRIRTVTEAIAREAPVFVVHTGDCDDDGQKWPLWEREFFGPARELLRQTTIWNTRGNHEHGAEPYATIFNLPTKSPWYSFDYANLHVAILDQWDVGDDKIMEPDRMTEMADWLDKDLAAAKRSAGGHADWIIVAGHQGVFNVAGHGSTWGHKQILPLLYKHGVDVFVCGHSHLYERFVPIGPAGAKPIQFIVAGGGGGYSYPSSPSPILVKTHSAPHYCLYHIDGDRLELTVKGTDGNIVDDLAFTKTNGEVSPSVLASAITPEDALRLLKVYKTLAGNVTEPPVAGHTMTWSLDPRHFPPGSKVTFATDPGSPWSVEPATFEAPPETSPELVQATEEADKTPPWLLKATPPPGVLLDQDMGLSPALTANITLRYKGRTWVNSAVPIGLHDESVRRLTPAPEIVAVPPAPAGLAIDGDPAKWQAIPALHLSSTGAPSRALKLAWDRDALYGLAVVEQGDIHTDVHIPANADSLEFAIESDDRRRQSVSPLGVPLRLFLYPDLEAPDGAAAAHRAAGRLAAGSLQTAWHKTPTGYTLEFSISAKGLTPIPESRTGATRPARIVPTIPLAEGRTLGLDLVLRHDGQIVEQFANPRPFRNTSGSPLFWGEIRLSPK